jgi:hypothetical protein
MRLNPTTQGLSEDDRRAILKVSITTRPNEWPSLMPHTPLAPVRLPGN